MILVPTNNEKVVPPMLKGKVHEYGAEGLKGAKPLYKLSSLSPSQGERDKG